MNPHDPQNIQHLVQMGKSVQEIAAILNLSESDVWAISKAFRETLEEDKRLATMSAIKTKFANDRSRSYMQRKKRKG